MGLGTAVRSGILWEDYDLHKPANNSSRRIDVFAKGFAARFAN
jgi:hypothetical protein